MNAHLLPVALLLLSACGHIQAYNQEIQKAEEAAAARPKPAPRIAQAARTLHVRVYADQDYRAQHGDYRGDLTDVVEVAALVLGPQLDVNLVLDGIRDWERACEPAAKAACLAELAELDAGSADTWVMGVTGATPTLTRDLDTLGHAAPFGNHLFVRGMGDQDAGDDFGVPAYELRQAEQRAQRAERLRHKGAVVMMHAMGHSLGGLHGGDAATLMSHEYIPEQAALTPASAELFAYMLDARLRGDDVAGQQTAYRIWLAEHPESFERAEYDLRLAELSGSSGGDAGSRRSEIGSELLTPEDRALLETARARARHGETDVAFASARELAQRYPNVAEVQAFACDLSRKQSPASPDATCSRAESLGAH